MGIFRGPGGTGDATTDAIASQVSVDSATASLKATEAANSATQSATSAASSATSATNAGSSETNAATSASNSAGSATASANSATASANSATASAGSATASSNSATSASTSETNAGNSATTAQTAQSAAVAAKTAAETAETNASTSAGTASTKAGEASTSATNALNSASLAGTRATSASNDAASAESSATSAASSLTSINAFYLGSASSNPTVDGNGNAVTAGDWYFNTSDNTTRIYTGSTWNTLEAVGAVNVAAAGALMDSEVTNLAQVKAFDSADYATSAQGTTADSAMQNLAEDTSPQLGGNLDLNSNNITGTGNITTTGTLQTSSNVIVGGDLTVSGTTTTVNTETINLADNNIVLNSNHTGVPSQNSGITVERGTSADKVFQWNETNDYWEADDNFHVGGNISLSGTVDGRDLVTDGTKLDNIEASADVTDSTNVQAAGALMDSEVTNLSQVKEFDSSDYATAAQGTTADNALPKAGGAVTGNLSFGDNVKATFGDNDLQIYHSGSASYITDSGTGNLLIQGTDVRLQNAGATANYLKGTDGAEVSLFYAGGQKLVTSSSGIDVTGNVVADGLTVEGIGAGLVNLYRASANANFSAITFSNTTNDAVNAKIGWNTNELRLDGTSSVRLVTDAKNRILVSANGDISFYEDTGTTAKLVWSAANESLTLTGGGLLMDVTAATVPIDIDTNISSTEGSVDILKAKTINNYYSGIALVREGSTNTGLAFKTTDSGTYDTRMSIDASGNVGISETDPKGLLHVDGFDYSYFSSNVGSATLDNEQGLAVGWNKSAGGGETVLIANQGAGSSGGMAFATNTSAGSYNQRMLLDASGNLLVGKTSAGTSNVGVELRPQGYIFGTGDGINPLRLNRKTSDGMIADFQKDGSSVGSIATLSGNASFGSGDVHLNFNATSNLIEPMSTVSGGASNGAIDLGGSLRRFKDLYLSGNVTTATVTSSGGITAGDASTAAEITAHYNDGSTTKLQGFGLSFSRAASYVRPENDGTQTLYVGGSTDDLDWNQIHFRSLLGLYMTGTRFITTARVLENITGITVDGNVKLDGNYPIGTDNVALGDTALDSANSLALRNVAIGSKALTALTSADDNIAIGYQAGQLTNTLDNIAIGSYALDGGDSGQGRNIAIGKYSMTGNLTTGSFANTCLGYRTGNQLTSGNDNTLLGYEAGAALTTGSDNVAIGKNTLDNINTENYNVAIGHSALGGASSSNYSTAVGYRAGLLITTGSHNTILGSYTGNQDGLDIRTLSNRIVITDGGGNIGMYVDNNQDAHFDGNVIAYSTTISDRRLKSDITNISNALDKVGQINGVTFVRNHNGEKAAGIVAQEIMEVLPEAVKSQALPLQTGEQDKEYYVVEYDAVTGLLVEAVKELKARVEALESK